MIKYRTSNEAKAEFERLAKLNGFGHYSVIIESRNNSHKRAIATCHTLYRQFTLTEFYAIHLKDEDLRQIILHEIAHAMTPGHGHNATFRRACRRIGAIETSRAHFEYITFETLPSHLKPNKVIVYACPSCGREFLAGRKWTRAKSCGFCAPRRWDVKFKLEIKEIRRP